MPGLKTRTVAVPQTNTRTRPKAAPRSLRRPPLHPAHSWREPQTSRDMEPAGSRGRTKCVAMVRQCLSASRRHVQRCHLVPRFGIGQHFRTSPFTFKPACLFQTGFGKNIGRVFGQCTLPGVPDDALPSMGRLEGGVSLRTEIHHAQHGGRLDEFGPEVLLRLKGTCPARVQGPWWGAQQREDSFEPNRGQSNNGGIGRKPNPTCAQPRVGGKARHVLGAGGGAGHEPKEDYPPMARFTASNSRSPPMNSSPNEMNSRAVAASPISSNFSMVVTKAYWSKSRCPSVNPRAC